MQSLGNDFVVLDGVTSKIVLNAEVAAFLADRHFGIGCDQILVAEADPSADFRFRIFNQDGSEVEQCGNGARCFARFLRDNGLTDKDKIAVVTINTRMQLELLEEEQVRVNLGVPVLTPANIPFAADRELPVYPIKVNDQEIEVSAISVGNPHAVYLVDNVDTAPVDTFGPVIESHPAFPAKANAGFMEVVSRSHIRLRVFERGVGETLGCGSGACAAVIAGILRGLLDHSVRVSLPGGDARVEWKAVTDPVYISGSAHTVFSGEIEVSDALVSGRTAA